MEGYTRFRCNKCYYEGATPCPTHTEKEMALEEALEIVIDLANRYLEQEEEYYNLNFHSFKHQYKAIAIVKRFKKLGW